MSYTTIAISVVDNELRDRVTAAIAKEVYGNPTFGRTPTGLRVKRQGPATVVDMFMWPIAIDNEAAYASALAAAKPSPGKDVSVISDASIGTGVQVHWPNGS